MERIPPPSDLIIFLPGDRPGELFPNAVKFSERGLIEVESINLLIEYHQISDLKPYEKNARKHAKKDIKTIVESIKEFGFNDPIGIWSEDNMIVEGHGRLMAAKEIGMDSVPCIRLDHLTEEQRRAYALAHNKTAEMSEWDMDLLPGELIGIEEIDMELFGFEIPKEDKEIVEDDYVESIPDEPKAKTGDIYQLGRHRLMCGDSTIQENVNILLGGGQNGNCPNRSTVWNQYCQ